jgi:hypothetical protein
MRLAADADAESRGGLKGRPEPADLLDLLDVGFIDATWVSTVPIDLAACLQEILDNPDA